MACARALMQSRVAVWPGRHRRRHKGRCRRRTAGAHRGRVIRFHNAASGSSLPPERSAPPRSAPVRDIPRICCRRTSCRPQRPIARPADARTAHPNLWWSPAPQAVRPPARLRQKPERQGRHWARGEARLQSSRCVFYSHAPPLPPLRQ